MKEDLQNRIYYSLYRTLYINSELPYSSSLLCVICLYKQSTLETIIPTFNPSTIISYALPDAGRVILKVYNLIGEEAATLVDETQEKGFYEINFNTSGLASGVYLYRIKTGSFIQSKKMIIIK